MDITRRNFIKMMGITTLLLVFLGFYTLLFVANKKCIVWQLGVCMKMCIITT
ncbi:twin-arginine translocation signal domain-containing protein [Ectobacillus funiculus]|uniref:Twin-arginine translocation signal domain-containing protein n=1 Tax=Ectobacillus funiculus TaxID=137993 RepID=A0ABV5WK04_9BACI